MRDITPTINNNQSKIKWNMENALGTGFRWGFVRLVNSLRRSKLQQVLKQHVDLLMSAIEPLHSKIVCSSWTTGHESLGFDLRKAMNFGYGCLVFHVFGSTLTQ